MEDSAIYTTFFFHFLKILFLSNLYNQHGAWTYNPEVKSHMLYWLSQPGAPYQIISISERLLYVAEHTQLVHAQSVQVLQLIKLEINLWSI